MDHTKLFRCKCGKSKIMKSIKWGGRTLKCCECDTIIDIEVKNKEKYLKDHLIEGVFLFDSSGGE